MIVSDSNDSHTLTPVWEFFDMSRKGGETMKKKKISGYTHTKAQLDDYARQMNPLHREYQLRMNNRSNQLNPNNSAYYASRKNDNRR